MRNQRTTIIAAGITALAALLTACGSDPEGTAPGPNYATVTGAGRNLDVPASLERRDYPNPCRLLPADTVQALLGAPATPARNASGCAWDPQSATIPTLQLSWIELGSDAAEIYRQRRVKVATAVPNLGESARIYRVNDGETARVDVLQPRAFFRVEIRTNDTAAHDLVVAQQIAVRVAQLVAAQVA